jgi:hypothetical protein
MKNLTAETQRKALDHERHEQHEKEKLNASYFVCFVHFVVRVFSLRLCGECLWSQNGKIIC